MLTICLALALFAPATAPRSTDGPAPLASALLLVDEDHGTRLARAGLITIHEGEDSVSGTVVLPETHESERVARFVPGRGGSSLYLYATPEARLEALQLAYVDHPRESIVAVVRGEPVLLAEVGLPVDVRDPVTDRSLLAEYARLDGTPSYSILERETELVDPAASRGTPREAGWDEDARVVPGTSAAQPTVVLAADDERDLFAFASVATVDRANPDTVSQRLVAYPCGTGGVPLHSRVAVADRLLLAHARPLHATVVVEDVALRSRTLTAEPSATEFGEPAESIDSPSAWTPTLDGLLELRVPSRPAPVEGLTRTWLLRTTLTATDDEPSGSFLDGMDRARRWDPPSAGRTRSAVDARFADVADTAGIATTHLEGPALQLDIRPTMGPGAAWGDIDGDGLPDLYLVQGGGRAGSVVPRDRLFRNRGDGTFEDVTDASGIDERGAGMGALFCDLDSDGDLDLYVANYGPDALFLNDGDGAFARADHMLPGHDLWSAGVAAADPDRDGDLDLYITSYLDYDESKMPSTEELARYRREDPVAMLPFAFPGQRNVFLRNDLEDGELAFTDATAELGLLDAGGRGMQPIFWDFDQDADDDLYVANDVSFNVLHRNEGDGTFRDVTFMLGLDDPRGGMGLAVGDVDRDGDEDLFLTNWQLEANALYQNNLINRAGRKLHTGTFADHTVQSRLGPAGIGVTGWGAELFDAENDGDLDLFVANGYTSPDYESTGICIGQPNHFFVNEGNGRFHEAHEAGGPALAERLASRGAVACDHDRDGLLDLLVTANNGRVQLLRNEGPSDGHWLLLHLRGSNGNTHAIGARIEAHCGEDRFVASLRAGTGYLTGNPPELHLGLGEHARVDELVVHWPSGRTTTHANVAADRVVTLAEPR